MMGDLHLKLKVSMNDKVTGYIKVAIIISPLAIFTVFFYETASGDISIATLMLPHPKTQLMILL